MGQLRFSRSQLAAAFAVLALIGIVVHLHATLSTLNQARKHAVSATVGRESCLAQELGGQGTVPAENIAFIAWVKRELPRSAVYELSGSLGEPDLWCITEVLLPALPTGPGAATTWAVVMDDPQMVQTLAAAHPDLRRFRPGYAIVRMGA